MYYFDIKKKFFNTLIKLFTMSFLKKIYGSIAFKLIVPIVILVIIIMVIGFLRVNLTNYKFINEKSTIESNITLKIINTDIADKQESALTTSSMLADLSSVKWAYSVYYKTKNLDSAYNIIKRNVKPLIDNAKKNADITPNIHFHLPPAKSLIRLWTDKHGDDLSSFRFSVLEISKTHKPVKTIEVGRKGFVIRGIAPIFNNKNEYLGSVEAIYPMSVINSTVTNDKKQSVAIFIKNEYLQNIANKEKNNINNNENTGDFSLLFNSVGYLTSELEKKDFNFTNADTKYKLTDKCVCAFMPVKDFKGNIIGVISTQIDISENTAYYKSQLKKNIISLLVVISIIILIIRWGIRWVVIKPINKLSKDIDKIAKGKIIDKVKNNNSGVIAGIYKSFNIMLNRLKQTTNFANKIGEGDLDIELENLNEEDVLGQSLMRMRDNLRIAKQKEDQNKKEAEKRAWATKGFAEFAEILRNSGNKNIEELSTDIIINIVKYTNSNQGGIFILNDNDKNDIQLELTAAYAYDRKKYVDKTIKLGEGLVGTCAIEKKSIFITDVPDNYLKITSGLGKSNPRCILIVPLKLEDEVFGVIELASFNVYEDYQIKFIEKLGESIASTLSTTKTNILTQELLEQSQQQQEELAATEEEMRQNLEEMQATQEQLEEQNIEIQRRNNEMEAQMKALDNVALISKTNPKGVITYVNDLFCEVAKYTREELIGKPHNIVRHPDMTKAAFKNMWDTIQAGKVWSGKVKNRKKDGDYYWVDANISPIYDENGKIKEYIAIRYLVTHYIDDTETVKLVHEVFPDEVEAKSVESDSNEISPQEEIKENHKEETIEIKENKNTGDTDLVKQLKDEHKIISDILVELQDIGVSSPKGMELLQKSKETLLNHLQLEDEKLYPKLSEYAKTNESFNKVLTNFTGEMEKITEFVLGFYSNYSDSGKINTEQFLKDITTFIVTLKDRVAKEEMILYKTYNKIING